MIENAAEHKYAMMADRAMKIVFGSAWRGATDGRRGAGQRWNGKSRERCKMMRLFVE